MLFSHGPDWNKFEKWIKIKKFDKQNFYVISIGNKEHEPVTKEMIDNVADCFQRTFPDIKIMVVPYYIRVFGFEIKEDESDEG